MLTRQLMTFVKTKCQENNVRLTPESSIYAFIEFVRETTEGKAMMAHILSGTPNGVDVMLDALGCTVEPGDSSKRYIVAEQKVFDAHDVVRFRGYVVKGFPAPHASVVAEKYELPQCESCGVGCSSTMMADSIHEGVEHVMCNHCRTYRDDIASEKVGSISTCQRCTKFDCSHHANFNYLVQRSHETNQKIDQFRIKQVK